MATMRVLVADQEPEMLEAIARAFEVDVATSKATCIDLLRANQFDVLVACERLSDGSGLELLSHVGQRWPQVIRILAIEPERRAMLRGRLGPFKLFETLSYPIDEAKLEAALGRAAEKIAEIEAAEMRDEPPPSPAATPVARPVEPARSAQATQPPQYARASQPAPPAPSSSARPASPGAAGRDTSRSSAPGSSALGSSALRSSASGSSAGSSALGSSAPRSSAPSSAAPSSSASRSTGTPPKDPRLPEARTAGTPPARPLDRGSTPSPSKSRNVPQPSSSISGGASFAGKPKPDPGYPPLPSKGSKIVPLGSPAAPDYKILPHNYQEPMPGTLRSAREAPKKSTLQEKAAAMAADALSAVARYIKPQADEPPPPDRPTPRPPLGKKR